MSKKFLLKATESCTDYLNRLRIKLLLLFSLFLIAGSVFAQTVQVNGKVEEENGIGIPGATVMEKGTEHGTITDFDGNFSIEVNENATLVFSFIGKVSQEINVKGKREINVILKDDVVSMQELVVVGYGTQKKVNLTGSVSTVTNETFENKGSLSTPLQALQGAVGGLTVTRTSGAPGREDYQMNIRGAVSANGSGVLVLIDGMEGNINDINPDDIDNMSILKDASASIYGARAAGGVILITTKRGSKNKTTVSYKGSIDFKKPGLQMKYMGMQHYMEAYEESKINDGLIPGGDVNIYPREVIDAYKTLNPDYMNGFIPSDYLGDINDYTFFDTDWNNVLYGTGVTKSHALSISGGNEMSTYLLSVGYYNEDGMLQWGTDVSKRYNIRLNYDFKIKDWMRLETSTSYDRRELVRPTRQFNINLAQSGLPTSTMTTDPETGEQLEPLPYAWGGQLTPNWIAKLGGEHHDENGGFKTNFKLTLDLTKDLSLVGTAAVNPWSRDRKEWENKIDWNFYDRTYNQTQPTTDKLRRFAETTLYQNYSAYFQFDKTLNEAHNFALMGGSSYESKELKNFTVQVYDLLTTAIYNLETGGDTYDPAINEDSWKWALASYFGRFNYNYKERYLLEALLRADGSSRFTSENRWRTFYSLQGAWRISEENFMQDVNVIDNLKLRASWGTMGNQAGIGIYDFAGQLNINSPSGNINSNSGLFGPANGAYIGQTITQAIVVSLDRTWETIETKNIGLDFSLLGNKIFGTFDVFERNNIGMLVGLEYPDEYGATAPRTNDGDLQTRGWDFTLGYRNKINSFNYYVNGTISDNHNKLIYYAGTDTKDPGYNYAIEGYPLNSYFGYERVGLITNQEEFDNYKRYMGSGIVPTESAMQFGDMMFKDLNNDGVIDANDIKFLGTNDPRYSFSAQLGADFKGFDFMANFQGVGKRTILRETHQRAPFYAWYLGQNDAFYGKYYSNIYSQYGDLVYEDTPGVAENYIGQPIFPQDKYDRTTGDLMPRLTTTDVNKYNYAYADWLVMNGAYVRLKNIVVGYTIPKKLISKVGLSKVRVYFAGTDLWELTYITDGWDPESPRNPNNGDQRYPFARTYSFGIDVNL
ncbi:SusC/RagA family TonB-linked outer membrane protein [Saccharicrinis sp. FJH62]|uniref:SusC/RagA family TonB-linked outer membrane protein n=1 Tax=Saccharicrinis sp. FJH62 TaxID=3344657 RepID=UPI0035D4E02E